MTTGMSGVSIISTYVYAVLFSVLIAHVVIRVVCVVSLRSLSSKYYESIGSPSLFGKDFAFIFRTFFIPKNIPVETRVLIRFCQLSFVFMMIMFAMAFFSLIT